MGHKTGKVETPHPFLPCWWVRIYTFLVCHVLGHDVTSTTLLKAMIMAFMLSYLFLRSTASSFWSEENRYFFHWQASDSMGVFFSIALLAALLLLAFAIVRRMGKGGRWIAELGFVMFLTFCLKVNIGEMAMAQIGNSLFVGTVLNLLLLSVFFSFVLRSDRTLKAMQGVCLILSPILLIYAVTLLRAETYPSDVSRARSEPIQDRSSTEGIFRVCLYVFDEWSYTRTFGADGNVKEEYPSIRRLASRSMVFHDAYSPAQNTFSSIPSLLCGVSGRSVLREGVLCLSVGDETQPVEEFNHLPNRMFSLGYSTVLIGNYLPLPSLFPSSDVCMSRDLYKILGRNPLAVGCHLLLENLKIRSPSFLRQAGWPFYYFKHAYFEEMAEWCHNATRVSMKSHVPSFIFAHYPVPHMPFIFDREGLCTPSYHAASLDPLDYEANLRYADTLIGDILSDLESSSETTETLAIFTSDHAFRADPELNDAEDKDKQIRHVPLFVFLPNSDRGRSDIRIRMRTASLSDVLYEFLKNGDTSGERFVELCNSMKEGGDK